jgi:diaminopimelate epimerase
MTGSGNDFVIFDVRAVDPARVTSPEVIRSICHRHNGIGADGIVLIDTGATAESVRIRYFNSDGTAADLCGNAALCSASLAAQLQLLPPNAIQLETDSGRITGRVSNTVPEIDLPAIDVVDVDRRDIPLEQGEARVGYAVVGVPHLVILCDDVASVDLAGRGPFLRHHPALGQAGANVNWVSRSGDGGWRYRTFERGVEGETQACGTGAVATAILLTAWRVAGGDGTSPVLIRTSSNRDLRVQLRNDPPGPPFRASLMGEGRVVFRGTIGEL